MSSLPGLAVFHALFTLFYLATATREPIPATCEQYSPLYKSIERDLDIFKLGGGITPGLFNRAMRLHSAGYREKGLAVAFYHGKAYVISGTKNLDLQRYGHHVALWVAYLRVMVYLEERYGDSLPNVELVWHTIDRPTRLTVNVTAAGRTARGRGAEPRASEENYPVLRFCKSEAHPDILVPIYHFYMKRYQSGLLDRLPQLTAELPWSQRTPKLFARFSAYGRYVHPDDPYTQRLGAGGRPLCERKAPATAICPVRQYLHDWAANYTDVLDINKDKHVPMWEHARYRYLLHVDGQGLSSKLETLLALGSLVMKEESGYMAFYHHLLQPYQHYLPVWRSGSGPEDILDAVAWAQGHDAEAARIAAAGQALVSRYLSAPARECFWLKLLHAYADVMTYDPLTVRNISTAVRRGRRRPLPRVGAGSGGGVEEVEVEERVVVGSSWRYLKEVRKFMEEEVRSVNPAMVDRMDWEP